MATCKAAHRPEVVGSINTAELFSLWVLAGAKETSSPRLTLQNITKKLHPLKVFVVPHSHNDPGWVKTLEDFFSTSTTYILDNIVLKLSEYKDMTFIWTEIVYLDMWWQQAPQSLKSKFIELVNTGRLEIAGGGWIMPDEAVTNLYAVLDQYIEGHQWLRDNIGIKPINSWQIDPFGHSASIAYLLNKIGFNNMVIQRIHHAFKWHLALKQNLEFQWQQYWDPHKTHTAFCHATPYTYYGIKWTCGPEQNACLNFDFRKVAGENSESRAVPITEMNLAPKAEELLHQYRQKAQLYRHNVVLVPLGDDFRYDRDSEFDQQYRNYKMLFDFINRQDWGAEVQFGTLSDYFRAVHERAALLPVQFPTLTGDFFPYSDQKEEYWSGFYTTRPFNKKLGRVLESRLRAADVLFSLFMMTEGRNNAFAGEKMCLESLTYARRALGLFQHHDAITGTSEGYVADDYGKKLWMALYAANQVILKVVQSYVLAPGQLRDALDRKNITVIMMGEQYRTFQSLPHPELLKVASSNKPVYILLYNSLTQTRRELVRVEVDHPDVEVRDENNLAINSQINPVWYDRIKISNNIFEVVFSARVSGSSVVAYSINKLKSKSKHSTRATVLLLNSYSLGTLHNNSVIMSGFQVSLLPQELFIQNDALVAWFDANSGFLQGITNKKTEENHRMKAGFYLYETEKSGAYIMGNIRRRETILTGVQARPIIRVVKGTVTEEMHVALLNLHHSVILDKLSTDLSLHLQNIVDARNLLNKEFIMEIMSDIKNDNTFYTDLNDLQVLRRQRQAGLTKDGAKFFPATSLAVLQDERSRLSVHLSQPHGVTSPAPGIVEVVMDRRMVTDDGRGIGGGVTSLHKTAQHFILLMEQHTKPNWAAANILYPSLQSHLLSHRLNHPFISMHTDPQLDLSLVKRSVDLPLSLPCDLRLVALRPLSSSGNPTCKSYALMVHRPSYDCGYDVKTASKECRMRGAPAFTDVFPGVSLARVKPSSLSFSEPLTDEALSSELIVNEMDISGYRIEVDFSSRD